MTPYLITYRIHDRQNFHDRRIELHLSLSKLEAWETPTTSAWIVVSDLEAHQIRGKLRKRLNDEDVLVVYTLGGNFSGHNIQKEKTTIGHLLNGYPL